MLLPISTQLLSLSDTSSLSANDKDHLVQIINQLFVDLDSGHSCSKLDNLSKTINVSPTKIIKLLKISRLVTIFKVGVSTSIFAVFSSGELNTMPITILDFSNECLIYISRYFYYELVIARYIRDLSISSSITSNASYIKSINFIQKIQRFSNIPNIEQLQAIINSTSQKFSIITGGPGTGKTTTVTLLLWVLYQSYGTDLKVKICAPTGKASKRVKESIEKSIAGFINNRISDYGLKSLLHSDGSFTTIHKLLGTIHNSIYFRYNQYNKLDIDVLIVDEASMIGGALFSKLLQAINIDSIKHIVFLGDKNQLSSVDEGSVFTALINNSITKTSTDLFSNYMIKQVSELLISNRNQGDVGIFAHAVLTNNVAKLENVLNTSNTIKLFELNIHTIFNEIYPSLKGYIEYVQGMSDDAIDIKDIFEQYNEQILLCLTNIGWLGSINLNLVIETKIKQQFRLSELWYSGRPIIILQNDYSLGLANGDIGICIRKNGIMKIVFDFEREVIPEVLPKYELAYAISIHKSQGSEYKHVNLVIPAVAGHNSYTILNRELVYTAVTRAKHSVSIFSAKDIVIDALKNVTVRNTGLNYFL